MVEKVLDKSLVTKPEGFSNCPGLVLKKVKGEMFVYSEPADCKSERKRDLLTDQEALPQSLTLKGEWVPQTVEGSDTLVKWKSSDEAGLAFEKARSQVPSDCNC